MRNKGKIILINNYESDNNHNNWNNYELNLLKSMLKMIILQAYKYYLIPYCKNIEILNFDVKVYFKI